MNCNKIEFCENYIYAVPFELQPVNVTMTADLYINVKFPLKEKRSSLINCKGGNLQKVLTE